MLPRRATVALASCWCAFVCHKIPDGAVQELLQASVVNGFTTGMYLTAWLSLAALDNCWAEERFHEQVWRNPPLQS